mmetsp:Transcript_139581/g.446637  ORF Transcript_139581/g.446637 Transcript_139581/m.446637 type:complete len:250 (-) Transcript_139581:707-1456(-)
MRGDGGRGKGIGHRPPLNRSRSKRRLLSLEFSGRLCGRARHRRGLRLGRGTLSGVTRHRGAVRGRPLQRLVEARPRLRIRLQGLHDPPQYSRRALGPDAFVVAEGVDALAHNLVAWRPVEDTQHRLQGTLDGPGAGRVRGGCWVLSVEVLAVRRQQRVPRTRALRVRLRAVEPSVRVSEQARIVVCGPADHHANQVWRSASQYRLHLLQGVHATVQGELQIRKFQAQAKHSVVHQGWYSPVLIRRQAAE